MYCFYFFSFFFYGLQKCAPKSAPSFLSRWLEMFPLIYAFFCLFYIQYILYIFFVWKILSTFIVIRPLWCNCLKANKIKLQPNYKPGFLVSLPLWLVSTLCRISNISSHRVEIRCSYFLRSLDGVLHLAWAICSENITTVLLKTLSCDTAFPWF